MGVADSLPLLVVGAVTNRVGTGLLLPSLLTLAMSWLDFADRGRGPGLWTSAFFLTRRTPTALLRHALEAP
ncbi:hypothetical protein [Streptomyces chryseus]|uniref:MFS transporter n=1 Tax=Streptomyces chryseus TaxID=68186 RepID=A0ABQ3DMA8_9ACTN|nr:hypothetical protein GCM10010353_46370 [Streptomyces chryseus]GHB05711.1 hypothetical protein GCM10010346_31070 [Streptomyces chryseus]